MKTFFFFLSFILFMQTKHAPTKGDVQVAASYVVFSRTPIVVKNAVPPSMDEELLYRHLEKFL